MAIKRGETMDFVEQVKEAFFSLINRANGNLHQISNEKGVDYSTIHKLKSGKSIFSKMSIGTLAKLFPNMRVTFGVGEDSNSVYVRGANHGVIANGNHASAVIRTFSPGQATKTPLQQNERSLEISDAISRSELEIQIMESKNLSPEEQVKFLLFLKKEFK